MSPNPVIFSEGYSGCSLLCGGSSCCIVAAAVAGASAGSPCARARTCVAMTIAPTSPQDTEVRHIARPRIVRRVLSMREYRSRGVANLSWGDARNLAAGDLLFTALLGLSVC